MINHVGKMCVAAMSLCMIVLIATRKRYNPSCLYVLFRTFQDNFQVKLFPPKKKKNLIFLKIFVSYMLMYFTFSKFELNPLDNKKDISLYVLFRTFQVNLQDISVTRIIQSLYYALLH